MTTDPRSVGNATHPWITNSRVYNLFWLGRWMERAGATLRAVDVAAAQAVQRGNDSSIFQRRLVAVAEEWRVSTESTDDLLDGLLRDRSTPSVYASIERARDNANEVAPLEIVQALNALLATIDESKLSIGDPAGTHQVTGSLLAQMGDAFGVVEKLWFRRGPLSQEEVYVRFVQQ